MRSTVRVLRNHLVLIPAAPALLVVGIWVHVFAWVLVAKLAGGQILAVDWFPKWYGEYERFGFGMLYATAIGDPHVHALAPSIAWLIIAAVAIVANAAVGQSRSRLVNHLVYVAGVALPSVALAMNASICFTRVGCDGLELYDWRHPVALGSAAAIAIILGFGWLRARTLAPGTRPWAYAYAWALMLCAAVALRNLQHLTA